MPELPEVRTVVKYLNDVCDHKIIEEVKIFYSHLLVNTDIDDLKTALKGQKINHVDPYGKYIIFHLDDYEMISHLRMEGKWILEDLTTYTYGESLMEAQFSFENETKVLRYYDSRRFGTLQLVKKGQWDKIPAISKLGYEPFDKRATKEYLYNKIHKSSKAIKTVLLDQTVLLGLGNIYVNEVLFASKINPEQPAKDLTLEDCQNILDNSITILNDSIANGGTTIHSFTSGDNHTGNYQKYLKVHGRANQPCYNCGTKIVYTKVNGRGTFYCPKCQPLK